MKKQIEYPALEDKLKTLLPEKFTTMSFVYLASKYRNKTAQLTSLFSLKGLESQGFVLDDKAYIISDMKTHDNKNKLVSFPKEHLSNIKKIIILNNHLGSVDIEVDVMINEVRHGKQLFFYYQSKPLAGYMWDIVFDEKNRPRLTHVIGVFKNRYELYISNKQKNIYLPKV